MSKLSTSDGLRPHCTAACEGEGLPLGLFISLSCFVLCRTVTLLSSHKSPWVLQGRYNSLHFLNEEEEALGERIYVVLSAQTTQVAGDVNSLSTRREELHRNGGSSELLCCSGPIVVRVLSTLAWVIVTATILVPTQSLFKEKSLFLSMYIDVSVCEQRGQWNPEEVIRFHTSRVTMVVSHQLWVLGTKRESSGGTASSLKL